jgi:hypothetical protein
MKEVCIGNLHKTRFYIGHYSFSKKIKFMKTEIIIDYINPQKNQSHVLRVVKP